MTPRTLAVVAVLALFAAAPGFAQCPSAASAPVAQSPTGNIAANTTVTFSWTPSTASGVTGYDILISRNGSGSTIACSATVASASQCTVASGFNAGGIYTWLVRAKITSCTPGLDSNVKSFTAGCPTAAPGSQSPADGSTGVALTPTLTWSAVPNATAYEIFMGPVSTASNACTGQAVGTTSTNSFNPPQLQPGTTYEWRVEAIGASGCPGVFSTCIRFTTTGTACVPPGAFSPVSPANNGTVTTDKPTLQWNAASGADKYFIHVGLVNPPAPQASDPSVTAPATTYTLGTSLPAGSYYWYVDAVSSCGGKTSSSVFKFTVATCSTTATTLTSPAANAINVTSPVTFNWTAVARASGYNLYVNDNLVTTTTDTKATAVVPQDGSHVTWYVDALFSGCSAVRSQSATFTTANSATCPTGSITLTAPATNSTVSGDNPVSFSWTGINGATTYRLFVAIDGGTPFQLARTINTNVSVALPNGSADWYVEALFNSLTAANTCPSVVSPHGKFTVTPATNCSTHKAATLASPLGGSVASPVDFNWTTADATTTLYRVFVSVNGQPFDDLGVTTATHLRSAVGPGPVVWYVQSFFEGCSPLNSGNATFTATAPSTCPTAAPAIIAPTGNQQVTSPVTFSWTGVANTDDYRILLSQNGGDFNLLANGIDGTQFTTNLPPGSYTWFVEATANECSAVRSTRAKFIVTLGQNCPTAGPTLLLPADGAANLTSPVTFDWSDVNGATGYWLIARHNDGAPTRLDDTTASESTKHLSPGTYEWWVVAFLQNCPNVESVHHTFTIPESNCDTKRPLLLQPADGAQLLSPVHFTWTTSGSNVASYKVWISIDGSSFSVLGTATGTSLTANVPAGSAHWFVEAIPSSSACPSLRSTRNSFTSLSTPPPCDRPNRPQATAVGQVASGIPYTVRWTAVLNTVHYELQESTTSDFSNATTQTVTDTSAVFTHTATGTAAHYFYRVRAVSSCSDEHSAYSRVVSVFVLPAQRLTSIEVGTSAMTTQSVKLPGQNPQTTFSVHADKPWVTVNPSSGSIGPNGVTLTVTSDPTTLNAGTNTATLVVTYGGSGKTANAVSSGSIPISVSLVTPVSPSGKNTPLPNSLIIPAVAHAQGANNSLFQSDVRIANVSATTQKYLLNFTLSGTDGTQSGQSTTIQIDPGKQMALDDILTTFFGNGSDGNSGAGGMLEIRPLSSSSSSVSSSSGTVSVQTVASSKTYNVTSNGTFGQFIPAISFSQFIAKAADGAAQQFISLQQIAQSSAYRTNFGLVEAAGEPADVIVHVIDNLGHELAALPIHLLAGEHQQLNSFLATNNINVTDGRIEVEVVSTTGKVSAYASVVDNLTNDPLLVFPVIKGAETATRYTIPGVADLNNGFASWRSDLRIFNPGIAPTDVTLAYYPQGNGGGPTPKTVTVGPGQVYAIDNALQSLYNLTNSGGAIVVTTPSTSALTVTARTYNQTGSGTYGQFIPAVSPADSVGLGDRTLQVLQLESSSAYRTNIGLSETNGNPVTIELSVLPDQSKVAAKLTLDLAANEFRQISLADFNLGTIYNTRVSVKVTNGAGRVTAYGSVIDQITQDPTYVPAQ